MTDTLKIAIIPSTTRQGRFADKAIGWITPIIAARGDIEAEVLDLRDHPLPFFDEPAPLSMKPAANAAAQAWEAKLAGYDGFVVVLAEYNHSLPAVLKNALDYGFKGWQHKPIGAVAYGGSGGARSLEHLRMIAINLRMVPVGGAVHIGGADFMGALKGAELPAHLIPSAQNLLDEIAFWARASRDARAGMAKAA